MQKIKSSKELKKSVYIKKDNMELLQDYLNQHPSLNVSDVVNSALSEYLTSVKYDGDTQIKKNEDYVLCVVRLHKILVKVLDIFKGKYKSSGVTEFINGHLLKMLEQQHFDSFPRKDNMGLVLVNKWAEKIKMKLVNKNRLQSNSNE